MAAATETATAAAAAEEKTVMVVGIDDSEHSCYALGWTLEHFSVKLRGPSPPFRLVIVHAKPIPSSVLTLGAPGGVDVLPFVEADLRKTAARVVEKAREVCEAKSVSPLVEVVEGDARYLLCEAVEKHHADMLVVGSHGYGAIKRSDSFIEFFYLDFAESLRNVIFLQRHSFVDSKLILKVSLLKLLKCYTIIIIDQLLGKCRSI